LLHLVTLRRITSVAALKGVALLLPVSRASASARGTHRGTLNSEVESTTDSVAFKGLLLRVIEKLLRRCIVFVIVTERNKAGIWNRSIYMYTANGLSSSVSDQFLYQAAAFEREERNAINRLSMVPRIAGVRFNRMINGTLMVPLGWMEGQNAGMLVKKHLRLARASMRSNAVDLNRTRCRMINSIEK